MHPVAVHVDEEVPGQQHPHRQVEEHQVHQAQPVLNINHSQTLQSEIHSVLKPPDFFQIYVNEIGGYLLPGTHGYEPTGQLICT